MNMLNTASPKPRKSIERNSISITVQKGRMVTVMAWTPLILDLKSKGFSRKP